MKTKIIDEYSDIRSKVFVGVMIDEEMKFWLTRLAQIEKEHDRPCSDLSKQVRNAIYCYLKYKLPNHFSMDEDYYKRSQERTGRIFGARERY